MWVAGGRIGRYELVGPLGRGASGEVWEALLVGLAGFRKLVALKILAGRDPAAVADFLGEARLGALVSHPHVVATFDLVADGPTLAIAMELVRGVTGADLARHGCSPLALVEVGCQAAAGLHHVHTLPVGQDGRAGLVHRDVKPSNLMVDPLGVVKVADLGISRLAGDEGRLSGTLAYMAPEQARGEEEPRSDVFSLGATLWALATRELPFGRGPQAAARIQAVERTLEDRSFLKRLDDLLPGLGEVVRACLRARPEDRLPSAAALGDALATLRDPAQGPSLVELVGRVRPNLRADSAPSHPSFGSNLPTVVLERGHLPASRDRFVGRRVEVDAVADRLRAGDRVVTLLGPGGMGKTRTALEAARAVRPGLAGGAWFVDLSAARDASAMGAAVADLLGVRLEIGDPAEQLGRALAGRSPVLLVLDNLEQVVEPAAALVARWRELAPEATFLCTSRVALKIRGEVRVPLGPLPVAEASELFTRRSPRPPEPFERADVEALVAELDGMPLAIELAAVRTRVLRPAQIRERLAERWRLLTATDRDRPDRHRSLRAALDGSFDGLSPPARRALAALSVFEGPFLPEAAEAVFEQSPDDPWVLDLLLELADHSLLQVADGGERFVLLQVVREYAREHVVDAADVARRHAAWFAQLGSESALASLRGRGAEEWTHRYGAAEADLIAGCRAAVAGGWVDLAVPLARAAAEAVALFGPFGVDRELLDGALAMVPAGAARVSLEVARAEASIRAGDPTDALARLAPHTHAGGAHGARCRLAEVTALMDLGRVPESLVSAEWGLGLARGLGDPWWQGTFSLHRAAALTLLGRLPEAGRELLVARQRYHEGGSARDEVRVDLRLASAAIDAGDAASGRDILRRAVVTARRAASRRELGHLLSTLATAEQHLGRVEDAAAATEQALACFRAVGDGPNEALVRGNRGALLRDTGRLVEAEAELRAAAAFHEGAGNVRLLGVVFGNLGLVRADLGAAAEATGWWERALALHRQSGNRRSEAVVLSWLAGNLEDPEEELAALREALARHQEVGNHRFVAITESQIGEVLIRLDRLDDAERALTSAAETCRRVGNRRHEGIVRRHTGRLHEARGALDEALRAYEEAVAIAREVDDVQSEDVAAGYLADLRARLSLGPRAE